MVYSLDLIYWESSINKLMVTDEDHPLIKVDFVIEVPIDYTRSGNQIKKVEDLLENIVTWKNVDLPYNLKLLARDIEALR